jgi:hypothetical protein
VRHARRIVTPIVVLLLVSGGVLCAPQPLFAWSVSAQNLTLYADRPFASGAGTRVLELAQAKLAASPLYAGEHHNIFVCSAPWRRVLLTHAMTGRVLGALDCARLPEWIREGYADYVGKGRAFDYDTAAHLYRDRAPVMDRWQSGLYLRYHLLVAYQLDIQHWTVPRLLGSRLDQAAVERGIETTIH